MKARNKRRICAALGALAFFLMLGVIGGMENGWCDFGRGAVAAVALEAVGAFLLWKAGVLRA